MFLHPGQIMRFQRKQRMKIAVVEDDAAFLETTKSYLERLSAEENLSIALESFSNGIAFLDSFSPRFDLIFMDIRMPNSNGMAVAKDIRKLDAKVGIIFLTNLTQYAIKGYEVEALDYLVKPIEYSLFKSRVLRAIQRLSKSDSPSIALTVKSGIRRIDVNDIRYVESDGHRAIYHLTGEDISVWESMTAAEKRLSQYSFLRCNSYYLVNLRYVDSIQGNTAWVGQDELKISPAKKQKFIDGLTLYLAGGDIR